MYIYGITGGIATGKSTLTKYLIKNGYKVIDCDLLVHESFKQDICKDALRKLDHTIIKHNEVDRKYLGSLLFNDVGIKKQVEEIIHPLVYKEIKNILNDCNDLFVFLDVPLLYEVGWQLLCNEVIVVYTTKEKQIERLMKRDCILEDEAVLKIKNQMNIDEKKKLGDVILDNNGTIELLIKQFIDKVRC